MNLKELVDEYIMVHDSIVAFGAYYVKNHKKIDLYHIIVFDELLLKFVQLGYEIFSKSLNSNIPPEDSIEINRAVQHLEKIPIKL